MIALEDVSLAAGTFVLEGVDLEVGAGEYAVLMGPTGCGKTTLLEAVCGLRHVRSGRVRIDGRDVTSARPADRGVGYVPQDGALFPTMTVEENLGFALAVRDAAPGEVRARAEELGELLGIADLLGRRVAGLSGGERQRVALGRAMAHRPRVLCLDEPLSALDDATKDGLMDELGRLREATGVTALHVTHSAREAARLGTLVFALADGALRRQDPAP